MFLTLFLIPLFTVFSALAMYRFVGDKKFLQLDLVQFLQAFVFLPIILVWSKSFLYYLLSNELEVGLSNRDLIIFDTALTVLLFYIFAFIVLHSLTKTFSIRKKQDPLYDIFELSEYFHLSLSHIIIYSGAVLVGLFFSALNVLFPLDITLSQVSFFSLLGTGIVMGIISFIIILNYEVEDTMFMKILKLLISGATILHILAYFFLDIAFRASYATYWFLFMTFFTLAFALLFVERSERATNFFTRIQKFFRSKV